MVKGNKCQQPIKILQFIGVQNNISDLSKNNVY